MEVRIHRARIRPRRVQREADRRALARHKAAPIQRNRTVRCGVDRRKIQTGLVLLTVQLWSRQTQTGALVRPIGTETQLMARAAQQRGPIRLQNSNSHFMPKKGLEAAKKVASNPFFVSHIAMNTILLLIGLSLFPDMAMPTQQQPSPTVQPGRPQKRVTPAVADSMNNRKRNNRKLRPDSLRRGGATRIDTVRKR